MIMVCGGLAPPLVDPPRLGVVTRMVPPNAVLKAPGQATLNPPVGVKVQVNAPPLLMVRAMLLSCNPAGMVLVKTTFGAGVCVVLLIVHTMLPAWPMFGFGTWALPATETVAVTVFVGGGGGTLVTAALPVCRTAALSSAETLIVSVTPKPTTCTITFRVTLTPGRIVPRLQLIVVTPTPPAAHEPWLGWPSRTKAPSPVVRTLLTVALVTGKIEMLVIVKL